MKKQLFTTPITLLPVSFKENLSGKKVLPMTLAVQLKFFSQTIRTDGINNQQILALPFNKSCYEQILREKGIFGNPVCYFVNDLLVQISAMPNLPVWILGQREELQLIDNCLKNSSHPASFYERDDGSPIVRCNVRFNAPTLA